MKSMPILVLTGLVALISFSPETFASTTNCTPLNAQGVAHLQVHCKIQTLSVAVSGQSNPWNQSINPTLGCSADAFPPLIVSLSQYGIRRRSRLSILCITGTTQSGSSIHRQIDLLEDLDQGAVAERPFAASKSDRLRILRLA